MFTNSLNDQEYMYYAYNLWEGYYIPFKTKEELVSWWINTRSNYELNITGKDLCIFHFPYRDEPEIYFRSWQILDQYGRSIDIRKFLDPSTDPERDPFFRFRSNRKKQDPNSPHPGRRHHGHRKKGPAMYRQTLRDNEFLLDEETEKYRDRIRYRKRMKCDDFDFWDYIEYYVFSYDYDCSKCWKDQSKARKQYNKHAKTSKRRKEEEPEALEDIANRFFSDMKERPKEGSIC